jgi:hypothetical protein
LLRVFVDGREVDRAQALNPRVDAFEFFFGFAFTGLRG